MIKNPADCSNEEKLITSAIFAQRTAPKKHEYNFHATPIMLADALFTGAQSTNVAKLTQTVKDCAESAQMGMIQMGLINHNINPGSSWIVIAHAGGWRFHPAKGFYLEPR